MTAHDRFLDTQPASHRAGGRRPLWRLHQPRLMTRRTSHIAIAAGIAAVTITVPPMIADRPPPGASVHAAPAPSLTQSLAPTSMPSAGPADRRDDVLLSRGRPVTASSVEEARTPASAAVDASLYTRWSSSFSDPQWLQVDLGSIASITQIVLVWDSSYAKAYQVQSSRDGQTWSTIHSTTNGNGGTETLTLSGNGRFLRMYGTLRATPWGYSLWELDVYGSRTIIGCDTGGNEALNQPVRASSVEKGVFLPGYAVDGDLHTRWSSAAADPQWIEIDLGASERVCQVVLAWEPACATAYRLQVSDEGSQWSTIYSTTVSTCGRQTLSVAGTGRYLRVYGTTRATAYGYSLWEVVVHIGTNP